MLRPRIIPYLLLDAGGLIKTVKFNRSKYVGDPMNAVRIFNEKEVDEVVVLDIRASVEGREPDFELIGNLAKECRMPFGYGGGVKSVAQVERLVGLGVEKVSLSSAAIGDPELISRSAEVVGSQSVVVVLDVKKVSFPAAYRVMSHNGTRRTGLDPVEFARRVEDFGAGEVVLNSIDCDGMMSGYDIGLVEKVRRVVNIPITAVGGAGSLEDIAQLVGAVGIVGAGAGSLFVFKGRYRAVLINYPAREAKDALFELVLIGRET